MEIKNNHFNWTTRDNRVLLLPVPHVLKGSQDDFNYGPKLEMSFFSGAHAQLLTP